MGEISLTWPQEERISLHRVAICCLIQGFRGQDSDMVLSSGRLSLKAVHVIAIALRGFLRQSLDIAVTVVERAALAEVTHKALKKGETQYTVMLGAEKKKRANDPREGKLVMSSEDNKETKGRQEGKERPRVMRREKSDVSGKEDFDQDDLDAVYFG